MKIALIIHVKSKIKGAGVYAREPKSLIQLYQRLYPREPKFIAIINPMINPGKNVIRLI